jgi:hypothetical protein
VLKVVTPASKAINAMFMLNVFMARPPKRDHAMPPIGQIHGGAKVRPRGTGLADIIDAAQLPGTSRKLMPDRQATPAYRREFQFECIAMNEGVLSTNVMGLGRFQLRCEPHGVFGATAPFHLALWGAGVLSPGATAGCLGTIKVCNGHDGLTS